MSAILEFHNKAPVAVFRIQLAHQQPAVVSRRKYAIDQFKYGYMWTLPVILSSYMKIACEKSPIIHINLIKIVQQELSLD